MAKKIWTWIHFLSRARNTLTRIVIRSGVFCITTPAEMLVLAFFITAPGHPHATSEAVYPALFIFV